MTGLREHPSLLKGADDARRSRSGIELSHILELAKVDDAVLVSLQSS